MTHTIINYPSKANPVVQVVSPTSDLNSSAQSVAYSLKSLADKKIGIITASTIYHVSMAGDDVNGDGSTTYPWATVLKALNFLSGYLIAPGAIITISIDNGVYTDLLSIQHAQGGQISLVAKNSGYTFTASAAVDNSDGTWTLTVGVTGATVYTSGHAYTAGNTISDGSGGPYYHCLVSYTSVHSSFSDELAAFPNNWDPVFAVGDYILIPSGTGTLQEYLRGCWPIVDVASGANNITVTLTATDWDGNAPTGALTVSGGLVRKVTLGQLIVEAGSALRTLNGVVMSSLTINAGSTVSSASIGIDGLIFASGGTGIILGVGATFSASNIAVSNCKLGISTLPGASVNVSAALVISQSVNQGIVNTGGTIVANALTVVCSDPTSAGTFDGVDATGGLLSTTSAYIGGNSGYGVNASKGAMVVLPGVTLANNQTADSTPALDTQGNLGAFIATV